MAVPAVTQLSRELTQTLTAVAGWSELGEYRLAVDSLARCDELLTKIYAVLRNRIAVGSPPS